VWLSNELLQLVVRKLKKKDQLKSVGKWECEVGQDWSTRSSVEVEGISESVDNVSIHCTVTSQVFHRQTCYRSSMKSGFFLFEF